jgi:hypothetical protein
VAMTEDEMRAMALRWGLSNDASEADKAMSAAIRRAADGAPPHPDDGLLTGTQHALLHELREQSARRREEIRSAEANLANLAEKLKL